MNELLRILCAVGLGSLLAASGPAMAQPVFTTSFSPATIGPGSASTLTYVIDNSAGPATTGLTFTNPLPTSPDMTIADGSASHTCGTGTLSAPSGGGTVSFSGGEIGAGGSCTITVNVTAPSTGTYTNPAVTLSTSEGSSDSLPVDLTVEGDLPGFSKSFAPNPITFGQTSTLTFTVDNSANTSSIFNLDFTDNLPAGVTVASPANASTDCENPSIPASLTAAPGSSTIELDADGVIGSPGFPVLTAESTCTVSVDVTSSAVGSHFNAVTLLADFVDAGIATDTLVVEGVGDDSLLITKEFTDDPVGPGGTATLEFTIQSTSRTSSATAISFTDDLNAMLTGATLTGTPPTDPCGTGSTVSGTTTLTLSGGTLAPEATCTFEVSVAIPLVATAGTYDNATSNVTGTIDGSGVVGNIARNSLTVSAAQPLTFTAEYVPDSADLGDPVLLRYTITNPNAASGATEIEFLDELTFNGGVPGGGGNGFIPSPVSFGTLPASPCGGSVSTTTFGTDREGITFSGGTVVGNGSCSFDIPITMPTTISAGSYSSTTGTLSATLTGATVPTDPATANITLAGGVNLNFSKEFTDDPVNAGGTATLEFTIESSPESVTDATSIGFTDDLTGMSIAGITATLPPVPDPPCGAGSSLTASAGDTLLTFAGASLMPGESCTFSVTVNVPGGTATGDYTNTTSALSASDGSQTISAPAASDDLSVLGADDQPLTIAKEFLIPQVVPGASSTIRFTISNANLTNSGDINFFTDNLAAAIPGLTATADSSSDTCGGTMTRISANTSLFYSGGSVAAASSCVIEVPVLVPAAADTGNYTNVTSSLSSTVGGAGKTSAAATAPIEVVEEPVTLSKSFTNDPVQPGTNATLEFTITNVMDSADATAVSFSDDLDAMLTGASFQGGSNTCGLMSPSSPGDGTFLTGDFTLAAASSCTITINVAIPGSAADGSYPNTTSAIAATVQGAALTGTAATDDLRVSATTDPTFTKAFGGPVTPGGNVTLTFSIQNNDGANPISALRFTDDLEAMLSGATASGLPADPCGSGSSLSGSNLITLNNGNLEAGGLCQFEVTVTVPGTATPDTYDNATSDLTSSGVTLAEPATAQLTVEANADLSVSLSDSPDPVAPGSQLTYTVTVDNAGPQQADDVSAVVVLPAGASYVSDTASCAEAPAGTLTCSLGSIAPAGNAQFDVVTDIDPSATSLGDATATVSTTTIDPDSGNNSDSESTTLAPSADIRVTKSDGLTSVAAGENLTYAIAVFNDGPSDAPSVSLTDTFPAVLDCTYTSTAAGGATGNTAAGSSDLAESLVMPAGSSVSYTATCAVPSDATGGLSNTASANSTISDPDTSNNSAIDSDTVIVPQADVTVTKTDNTGTVVAGQSTTYIITVSNAGPSDDPAVDMSDAFPAVLDCGYTSAESGGATGNTAAGSGDISDTLSLPVGSSVTYTAACDIAEDATGVLSNTASATTSATDPTPADNSATDTSTIEPQSDVSVTKTDNRTNVTAGESLIYEIVALNSGPSADPAVSLTDTFPAALDCTYTSTPAGGATGNTSGAGDLAETLSLPVGGSVTYLASCDVDPAATGTLSNTATVAASVTDPDPLNDSATDETAIDTEADIAVTKTDNRLSVAAGTSLTYEIIVTNNGPSADPSVSLTDTFPAILTCAYTSSATAGATGNTASGSGDLGETLALAPGSSVTYLATCDVPIDGTGTLSNTATVSGSVSDPDGTNDSATDSDTVIAEAVLDFAKTFGDATIVQGETTVLTFTIENGSTEVNATGLTFSDTFPDILVVADTPAVVNGCNGTFTATPGSDTVSLSGGDVGFNDLCTIDVTVKATGFGTFDNPVVALTSSFPDAELISDSLVVTQAPGPAFSKLFDDETITQGESTGLTFTIDNGANGVDAADLAFTDPLPGGLVVTQSASATNDCGGTLSAADDATSIALSGGTVAQGASCTIFVQVRAIGFGAQDNPAITLTSSLQDSTLVTDSLQVDRAAAPGFSKLFADDEIVQGATTQLTFTIDNSANAIEAADLAFTDVFPDTLVVADAPAADNQCNGTLTADPGTDTISLAGGSVAEAASCTITVTLKATGFGDFENPVITLTSTLPDAELVTDTITVTQAPGPTFTKEFGAASILQGNETTLTFTIENTSLVDAEGLAFTDPLPGGLVVANTPATANACGGSFTANAGANSVSLAGASLPAENTCTISLAVRGDVAGTDIQNVTSALTSSTLPDGDPATAMITVAPNPLLLSMVFAPDTIQQNQNSLLTYTFTNNANIGASSVSLSDTLPANVVVAPAGLVGNRCNGAASAPAGGTTVSLAGGTLAAGGSCTVVVNVTSATVGIYPNTTEAASSSLGDSAPASDTLEVTGATSGSITIVQNADIDGTFSFSSATPDLNFSLTTEGGTAQEGPIPLGVGTYVVTQTRPQGFGNVGLFCDDGDSSGDAFNGILTIVLGSLENVTCTFVSIKSDQVTIDLINRFMTRRADLILSNQPDMARRLERLNRGFGDAEPVTFRNGDLAAMMPFTFNPMSVGSGNYHFSTSLAQVDRAAASIRLGHGAPSAFIDNRRFDAWVELSFQKFDDNASNDGHFGIGYAGVDYLFSPDLLVGAVFQIDTMEDSDAAANNSASGTGWMFGPYLTARLAPSLFFDARLAYGRSNNFVSPFNTYTDNFSGERWLVTAGLSGEFKQGPWTIRPRADLSYYQETQQSYIDSLNVLIPSQTVSLGQVQIGPTISGRFELANGVISEPTLTLDGIYNFGDTSGVTVTDPTSPHTDGFRGRIKAGVNFTNEMGTRFGISGIYDGIGRSDFESLGLSFDLNIPLYKAKAR